MSDLLRKVLEEAKIIRVIEQPSKRVFQIIRKDGGVINYENCEIEVEQVYDRWDYGYTNVSIKIKHGGW